MNKNKPIKQKKQWEIGKDVWIIKDEEGNIFAKYKHRYLADINKPKLERFHLKELFLERTENRGGRE
jgi:hypothetical protein